LTIIGLALAAAECAASVWVRSLPRGSGWYVLPAIGWLIPLAVAIGALVFSARRLLRHPAQSPGHMEVAAGSFRLEPQMSPGWATLGQLSFYGLLLGQLITQWREGRDPDPVGGPILLGMDIVSTVVIALWTALVAVSVAGSWNPGPSYELTPAGIHTRAMFGSWFIPWEALYTGGPLRPELGGLTPSPVRLAVARPELVRCKGLIGRFASRQHPVLPAVEKAHPWLLADAIRWYAEHPEHRADIGTQEEHDRLISTVTADYPQIDETPRARPGLVTAAVWVALAGASVGVLLAAANLYIAVAFQDRIAAAVVALGDEESLFTDPVLPAIWFGLVLLGAVLTGLAARGVWRGSPGARAVLIVLSTLVVLSGCVGSCFGSSTLSLLDAPNEEMLGMAVMAIWMGQQAVAFTAGVTVIVLLVLRPSADYFKPRFLANPAVVKV
jgi:hypothetical protein